VASLTTATCVGLSTSPNDIGDVPEGALVVAQNVVVSKDGVIEPRRGMQSVYTMPADSRFLAVAPFMSAIIGLWREVSGGVPGWKLVKSTNNGATWTAITGVQEWIDPLGSPSRMVSERGNLYTLHKGGVFRTESLSSATNPTRAGMPFGLDLAVAFASSLGVSAPGSMSAPDTAFAYRAIWTYEDANGNKHVGAPTARVLAVNAAGSGITSDIVVNTAVPALLPSGSKVEFYRTAAVAAALANPDQVGDEMAWVGSRTVPGGGTIETLQQVDGTTVEATFDFAHGLQVGDVISTGNGTAGAGGAFTLGTKWLLAVPSATTVRWAQTGTPGAPDAVSIDTVVLAVGLQDSTPDTLRGAALYTSPTQDGILQAHYPPPVAGDMAAFRGCLFFANTADPQRLNVSMLAVGSPKGVQNNDTVTIDGTVFTAKSVGGGNAEIPDDQTNTFLVFSAGSAEQNLADTANSLVRAINRYGAAGHTIGATYASKANGVPGRILLARQSASGTAFTFTTSRATAFEADATSEAEANPNGLAWSRQDIPDAVPLLNRTTIGSKASAIKRIIALRDSLLVLKGDGIWRLTGDSPDTFRVDPLDLTVVIEAPETVAAAENTALALTPQGVVRISDTGVSLVSRPIENLLAPYMVGSMAAQTRAYAHAVAYDSSHLYIMWLPGESTVSASAYVFDLFTQAWTKWNTPSLVAMVDPATDKLYTFTTSAVRRERKALTAADYVDDQTAVTIATASGTTITLNPAVATVVAGDRITQSGASAVITAVAGGGATLTLDRAATGFSAGAATIESAYLLAVEWSPKLVEPGRQMHAREAKFHFRRVYFSDAAAYFGTDLVVGPLGVALSGANLGLVDPPVTPREIRSGIPRNAHRGSRLRVGFSMQQAQCALELQGVTVLYEASGERPTK
jgi:hypothetical protein